MSTATLARWRVLEVHNFGGFFGGDTVTLTAARLDDATEETITIDEKALVNVCERHCVAPSMVFDLLMVGERVDRAELVAAETWSLLDQARGADVSPGLISGPRIHAYRCEGCSLWVLGEPDLDAASPRCRLCGSALLRAVS